MDLDLIFSVLENPIRRKILEKLAEESHYPLQLSKELNISQQAIMKHLKVLEDNDLVVAFEEKSTLGGPPRKAYVSKKRITLRIDVGPNTFNSEIFDYKELYDQGSGKEEVKKKDLEIKTFEKQIIDSQKVRDVNLRLREYSKIIKDINEQLYDLKIKRAKLVSLREGIISQSNKLIAECCNEYNERKILYYLLTHQDRDFDTISELMDMRVKAIEAIFNNLMKQHLLIEDDEETSG